MLAAFSIGLWSAGHQPISLALTLGASAGAAFVLTRSDRRLPARGAREVPMAIVPWGIVVTPDGEPRVLRWPAVRRITVDVTHTLRGGTPAVVSSLVTVRTDHEVLAGRTPGSVDLERLLVNLDAYSREASRLVAMDLEGAHPLGDGATEAVVADVAQSAYELCSTAAGAARLGLPSGTYRSIAARLAGPETIALLRSVLVGEVDSVADPRPLAAVTAGLLNAKELVPELLHLTSSPHPVVAAVARAAAARLGAPRKRAGSVDEVEAFLFQEDHAYLTRWANAESPVLAMTTF